MIHPLSLSALLVDLTAALIDLALGRAADAFGAGR